MSKAKTRKWVKIVAGLLLGTVSPAAAAELFQTPGEVVLPASGGRPGQAHDALNRAIESYRRGDYELAAPLFKEAETRQADLSATERQELARLQIDNREALMARHFGAERLRQVETALREGRTAEADEKLKAVASAAQYLTAEDRQRLQQIQAQRPRAAAPADVAAQARTRVQQARAQLNQHDLDAAERLAREAEQMGHTFAANEDSPKRVLQDLATARTDAKVLLAASRACLKRSDYDRADFYAKAADKESGTFTFPLWASDSPSKALKDIDAARKLSAASKPHNQVATAPVHKTEAAKPAETVTPVAYRPDPDVAPIPPVVKTTGTQPPDSPPAPPIIPPPPATMPKAPIVSSVVPKPTDDTLKTYRGLIADAQRAMHAGELLRAHHLAQQACDLNMMSQMHDEAAPKLLAEIKRLQDGGPVTQAAPPLPPTPVSPILVAGLPTPPPPVPTPAVSTTSTAPADKALAQYKALVTESQRAMQHGDMLRARKLALQACDLNTMENLHDDRAAKQLAAVASAEAAAPMMAHGPAITSEGAEAVRTLLAESRQAMKQGELKKARSLAEKARSVCLRNNLHDDSPDLLLADIARAEGNGLTQVSMAPASAPAAPAPLPKVTTREEAVALLRQGRAALDAGKLEEAGAIAVHLKAADQIKWRIFDETPDSLQKDVEKIDRKKKQAESVKVLADARKMLEKGNYDGATKAAYRAQNLHGAYDYWDFGDRPSKLLAEIETAKARDHKVTVQSPEALVNREPTAAENKARDLLAQARTALKNNDLEKARQLADEAGRLNVVLNKPGDDSPAAVFKDINAASVARRAPSVTVPQPPSPIETVKAPVRPSGMDGVPAAPSSMTKARAQQLLAEAHKLQADGKLIEASQKVTEAQKAAARFGPDEESPDMVAQQLALVARRRTESLVRRADAVMSDAGNDPTLHDPMVRYQKAEEALAEASKLAIAFRQDAEPVTWRLERVRSLRGGALAAASLPFNQGNVMPVNVVAAPPTPSNQGQMLLQKARLELSNGSTGTARKLAEEALAGNWGVQSEAQDVLRTIDAEESNQRALEARRTLDAATDAFNHHEYDKARELLGHVEMYLLDPGRQTRYREIVQTPQMQPNQADQRLAVKPAQAPTGPPTAVGNDVARTDYHPGAPGKSTASDNQTLLESTIALREVKFQKLRQQGLDAMREASEKFKTGQTDAALEMLNNHLAMLNDEALSTGQTALLRRPVEYRLDQFKMMKAQRDFLHDETSSNSAKRDAHTQRELVEQNKQKQVVDLMKKYNALYKQTKYEDAVAVALQAKDLDPDNAVVVAAVTMAKTQIEIRDAAKNKTDRAEYTQEAWKEAERGGSIIALHNGVEYSKERWETVNKRKPFPYPVERHSQVERDIERKLTTPTTVHFQDLPLRQAVEDLRQMHGLNIDVDEQALRDKGIGLDRPVNVKVDGIALKSALNVMLGHLNLTYIVDDGILKITTPDHARGKMELATHYIADLVIPVGNFDNLPFVAPGAPPRQGLGMTPTPTPGPSTGYPPPTPLIPPYSLQGGTQTGTGIGSQNTMPPTQADGGGSGNWSKPSLGSTQERELMRMIMNVVSPQSWTEMGGPGTIDYHPLTMSLVVNQTADIQEQIADLLAALRRLQDQEVSVEVRFISVADDFYERVAVNMQLAINTNNQASAPQLVNGTFAPLNFINAFRPNNFLAGATQAGTLTSDLAIPITNNTFFGTQPQFGGYPGIGVGGLTMGLAFLSDIQVYLFMEAVQGDTRTHITQAPKLTLFNGQTATLAVQTTQNFVTNMQLTFVGNGNPVFVPTVTPIPIGVNLTVQAVITADRRFVRMSLNPTLTVNVPGPVNTFPIIVPIFQGIADDRSNPITITQLIQQPAQQTINVATTVSVPDGGTVVLGGLKRLSEQRVEQGPPIVSNIPILNRLFKNVGFGRETESLMLMVTPRIIIQEEEEERQTGYHEPVPPQF